MAHDSAAVKVVLDTNVLISATLFGNGVMKPLRLAWQTGRVLPAVSQETRAELLRVLAYDKFKLSQADIARALASYLPHTQFHAANINTVKGDAAPICRDERDQMFLDLALSAKVAFLVTGDQDLLVLAKTPGLPFRIIKPVEFLAQHLLPT